MDSAGLLLLLMVAGGGVLAIGLAVVAAGGLAMWRRAARFNPRCRHCGHGVQEVDEVATTALSLLTLGLSWWLSNLLNAGGPPSAGSETVTRCANCGRFWSPTSEPTGATGCGGCVRIGFGCGGLIGLLLLGVMATSWVFQEWEPPAPPVATPAATVGEAPVAPSPAPRPARTRPRATPPPLRLMAAGPSAMVLTGEMVEIDVTVKNAPESCSVRVIWWDRFGDPRIEPAEQIDGGDGQPVFRATWLAGTEMVSPKTRFQGKATCGEATASSGEGTIKFFP